VDALIELAGIGYSYPETAVLKDLDLSIAAGESVALIGPNGSGKSTLLKLLCGLLQPGSGGYRFAGEAIDRRSLADASFSKSFHKRMGFVFQDSAAQLFCASVYDEIAFGPRQMGLAEEEAAGRVAELARMFRIEALMSRVPYHLSGGEKRKVAIASALALAPDALCLDEPMGGLDPRTKRELRGLMASLNASGITLICATHDFEYVDGIFKRAVVLSKDGNIVRDAPYGEVVSDRGFLAEMNII
jgi:ABC-type cobalt transport system, ATPase component